MMSFYVHDSSYIERNCSIGDNTKIWHFCHISEGSRIGNNCTIGQNVYISGKAVIGNNVKIQNNISIYDNVIIEDDVFLGPSCVFTNVINPRSFIDRKSDYLTTIVSKGATIGANATIVCGNIIGIYAFVGAGAVVTKDIHDFSMVVGNPSFQIGYVCRCGERLTFEENIAVCLKCDERYFLTKGRCVRAV